MYMYIIIDIIDYSHDLARIPISQAKKCNFAGVLLTLLIWVNGNTTNWPADSTKPGTINHLLSLSSSTVNHHKPAFMIINPNSSS